jgi:DNA-binding transcriptional ArsR family regulator
VIVQAFGNPRKEIDPLGHPAREEILEALAVIGELTPTELAGYLPVDCDRPTTNFHLSILERAELVERIGGVCRLSA